MGALNPEVLRMVQLSTLGEKLGKERLIFNRQTAVEHYFAQEFDLDIQNDRRKP